MAIFEQIKNGVNRLTDKLRSPFATTVEIIPVEDEQAEQKRLLHFSRLYDYYIGDETKIKEYIYRQARVLFKKETLKNMLLPYMNLVRKVLDRTCLVYKVPAERYVLDEKSNENYQKLLTLSNINARAKEWHKLAKLMDTVYVQARWRVDHIEYDIFTPNRLTVIPDDNDYLSPKQVRYDYRVNDGTLTYIWEKEKHWVLDESGKLAEGENGWGGVNKYGVLPFAVLRLRDTEDHWGEGDTQLVDINEKINVLLMSGYHNAIFQAHGQLVGINTRFDPKKGDKLATGPDNIIQIENANKDTQVELKYIHPDPAIEEVMKKIDWLIKTAAMMRGIPAASLSIDATAESGLAKSIDSWELLEQRENDIEWLRPFEKKLFEISRVVWNFHAPSQDKIDESVEFGIDFVQPQAPQSRKEYLEQREIEYKFGLWTPVDDMADEDENIDRDKAKELILQNLQIRKEFLEASRFEQERTTSDNEPPDPEGSAGGSAAA